MLSFDRKCIPITTSYVFFTAWLIISTSNNLPLKLLSLQFNSLKFPTENLPHRLLTLPLLNTNECNTGLILCWKGDTKLMSMTDVATLSLGLPSREIAVWGKPGQFWIPFVITRTPAIKKRNSAKNATHLKSWTPVITFRKTTLVGL